MELTKLTLPQFSDQTAADVAVPGGGCVAALSANLGASLVEMVGLMTERKAKKQGVETDADVQEAMKITKHARDEFLKLIDKDAAAFDGCMQAFALPKGTEEEKAKRVAAIQESYKNAVKPPFTVAKHAMEMIKYARTMVEKGDQNALSDACVAVRMLNAAAWGGIYNVKINLSAIKDEQFVAEKTAEIQAIEKELEELTHSILDKVTF